MENIEYVKETLPYEELLCQLSEECAELIQAAMKLRRAITKVNPTPVTYETAMDNVYEEIADILGVLKALELDVEKDMDQHNARISHKYERWVGRLKEIYGE